MAKLEPRRPQIRWNHLGRQLKLWRSYHINEVHCNKLLRLWVGYEFLDLLDEFGRIPVQCFNEARRRLGYKTSSLMLDDVRRCRSFYLVGINENQQTAIFSPIWRNYDPIDGMLLTGSIPVEESHSESQPGDYSIEDNKIEVLTGGNTTVFSTEGCPEDETANMKRITLARRRIVKDYFTWLQRQQDSDHRYLYDDIIYRLCNPKKRTGEKIAELTLTPEQGKEAFQILVDDFLVPYFQTREDFFKKGYMEKPETRIHWLKNFFRHYAGDSICKARKRWRHRSKELEAQAIADAAEMQMQYRPRSPHEWEDSDGNRWYVAQNGSHMMIPEEAEPRPSAEAQYNSIAKRWIDPITHNP